VVDKGMVALEDWFAVRKVKGTAVGLVDKRETET
jgi:hypothetical protein